MNSRKRRSHEDFVKDIYDIYKDEYAVLGTFVGTKTKILVRHNPCGKEYETNPTNLLRGYKCMDCYGKPKKTTIGFKKEVTEILGNDYKVVGKYINNREPIEIYHKPCESTYFMLPTNIVTHSYNCPICSKRFKKDTDYFKEEIKELKNDKYELLSEYVNTNTRVLIKHKICGQTFEVIPDNFINKDSSCPYCCRVFKGEEKIRKYLERKNMAYKRQYQFDDCKHINKLFFDFAVFDKNNSVQHLIEYDGIQHFEPIDVFGGEKEFKINKFRDNIKDKYCKSNGINLIRIPYYNFEIIELILDEIF